MKFDKSVDYSGRKKFPLLLEQLPADARKAISDYLVWRNAAISKLDYNLVVDFVERIKNNVAGDQTETFLCEALKEAVAAHTTLTVFRRRFDGAWWKRVPKKSRQQEAQENRRRISAESFAERKRAGQTYQTSAEARLHGWAHRTSGHA